MVKQKEETCRSLIERLSTIVDTTVESVEASWNTDTRAKVFNQSNGVIVECKKELEPLIDKVNGLSEYFTHLQTHLEDPLPTPPEPPSLLDRLMKTTGITGEEDFFASLEEEGGETEDPYLYRVKVKGRGGFLARLLGQP